MPTFERTPRFDKDWSALPESSKQRFRESVTKFVADLTTGTFRAGLRVKRVEGTSAVWEMPWAPNGLATWQYGEPVRSGETHVVWRRVGTHDIFIAP
ncbi:MAG: hypothetical protein ACRDVZ_17525 [Jiangellaceae bacterium]